MPSLAPRPPYVLLALIGQLQKKAVLNAEEAARQLLPGVAVPFDR
jgi:hypothetical protein